MIAGVRGREILDSRGRPTVEAELTLADGTRVARKRPLGRLDRPARGGRAPRRRSGALRRAGRARRGGGRRRRDRRAALRGREPTSAAVDGTLIELDGTPDKSRLGANAILAVSLAVRARRGGRRRACRCGATSPATGRPPLPMPMVNIISGGLHAGRQLDFQDFLVIPAGAGTLLARRCEMVVRGPCAPTADVLAERGLTALKADEGGYGPPLESHAAALELLDAAVERAGLRLGDDVAYALDVAATHFYDASSGSYGSPRRAGR